MTVNNIARNQMEPAMQRLASGNRINSARDDAAGAAIVETMTAQLRGIDQGTSNTMDMQALAITAEGGMDTISDSLNRIRELSVQAMNDTNTPANREMIQSEISQLADQIQSAVGNVEFNTIPVLDGSAEGLNTAASANGSGPTVNIRDMSSLAQAITQYNVTGSFNLEDIDQAMNEVSGQRAETGATINRLDYTANANTITSLNMADSRSRINDADIAAETASLNQQRVIDEAQILMQAQEQRREERQGRAVTAAAGQ